MYQIGELIVYGCSGVCRVVDHTELDIEDVKPQLYYVLEPLYQTGTIYCPVEDPKVFMRPVISREEAEKIIDMIPTVKVNVCHHKTQQLREYYESVLHANDCEELVMLTMSIYEKRRQQEADRQKFGEIDTKYMKLAENILYGELATALGIEKDDVPQYIAEKLGKE